jgi:hypothetical protein
MSVLLAIFGFMFLYGVVAGKLGAALLSLLMAIFVYYSKRVMDRKDREWESMPQRAKEPPATCDVLRDKCCECSADRL